MKSWNRLGLVLGALAICAGSLVTYAQTQKKPAEESERKIKEAEVPAVALAALKKLAAGAALTEFSEEIEHGHKFYEGTWKGADGKVDGLVTEAGDMVEVEAAIPGTKAPAAVRAAAEKAAGKDATVKYEKKTVILYEIHYRKDGKGQEMIFTPDGRQSHEDGAKGDEKGGKDDDDDD